MSVKKLLYSVMVLGSISINTLTSNIVMAATEPTSTVTTQQLTTTQGSVKVSDWDITTVGDTATIFNYHGSDKDVVIPLSGDLGCTNVKITKRALRAAAVSADNQSGTLSNSTNDSSGKGLISDNSGDDNPGDTIVDYSGVFQNLTKIIQINLSKWNVIALNGTAGKPNTNAGNYTLKGGDGENGQSINIKKLFSNDKELRAVNLNNFVGQAGNGGNGGDADATKFGQQGDHGDGFAGNGGYAGDFYSSEMFEGCTALSNIAMQSFLGLKGHGGNGGDGIGGNGYGDAAGKGVGGYGFKGGRGQGGDGYDRNGNDRKGGDGQGGDGYGGNGGNGDGGRGTGVGSDGGNGTGGNGYGGNGGDGYGGDGGDGRDRNGGNGGNGYGGNGTDGTGGNGYGGNGGNGDGGHGTGGNGGNGGNGYGGNGGGNGGNCGNGIGGYGGDGYGGTGGNGGNGFIGTGGNGQGGNGGNSDVYGGTGGNGGNAGGNGGNDRNGSRGRDNNNTSDDPKSFSDPSLTLDSLPQEKKDLYTKYVGTSDKNNMYSPLVLTDKEVSIKAKGSYDFLAPVTLHDPNTNADVTAANLGNVTVDVTDVFGTTAFAKPTDALKKVGDYTVTYTYKKGTHEEVSGEMTLHVTSAESVNVHHSTLLVGEPWKAEDNFDSATDQNGDPLDFSGITVTGADKVPVTAGKVTRAGSHPVNYSYNKTTQTATVAIVDIKTKQLETQGLNDPWNQYNGLASVTSSDGVNHSDAAYFKANVQVTACVKGAPATTVDPTTLTANEGEYTVTYTFQGKSKVVDVKVEEKILKNSSVIPADLDFGKLDIQYQKKQQRTSTDNNGDTTGSIALKDTRSADGEGFKLEAKQNGALKGETTGKELKNSQISFDVENVKNSANKKIVVGDGKDSTIKLDPTKAVNVLSAAKGDSRGETTADVTDFTLTIPKDEKKAADTYKGSITWTLSDTIK